jgi:DNA topoisomerase VI subunit B
MNIEPISANCVVDTNRDHPPSMDFEESIPEIDVEVQDTDEEDYKVLPPGNKKGITKEDYDQLYRHLYVEYTYT